MSQQPDRRQKVRALLDSPFEGERAAARAALDRTADDTETMKPLPPYGTTEWHDVILEWCRKIEFCVSRLGSPLLSKSDVVLIRNINRCRGQPAGPGARQFLEIYTRLKCAEDKTMKEMPAVDHSAGRQ